MFLVISEGQDAADLHVQVPDAGSVVSVSNLDAFPETTFEEESIDTPFSSAGSAKTTKSTVTCRISNG